MQPHTYRQYWLCIYCRQHFGAGIFLGIEPTTFYHRRMQHESIPLAHIHTQGLCPYNTPYIRLYAPSTQTGQTILQTRTGMNRSDIKHLQPNISHSPVLCLTHIHTSIVCVAVSCSRPLPYVYFDQPNTTIRH